MKRFSLLMVLCIIILSNLAMAKTQVEVTCFDLGKYKMSESFWHQYDEEHDAFIHYVLSHNLGVDVWALADDNRYRTCHDSRNMGLSGKRLKSYVKYLISRGLPEERILSREHNVHPDTGCDYRATGASAVAMPQPVVDTVHIVTEHHHHHHHHDTTTIIKKFFLTEFLSHPRLALGYTSTFFNSVPTISGRLGNNDITFRYTFGHSLAKDDFYDHFECEIHPTHTIYHGVHAMINLKTWQGTQQYTCSETCTKHSKAGYKDRPISKIVTKMDTVDVFSLNLVAGGSRTEDRSTKVGRYARKYRAIELGLQGDWFLKPKWGLYLGVQALWTPGEEDVYGREHVIWMNNQYRISAELGKLF